ncbi:MAG: transposase family protein [Halobacteriovoraceae bacterium]|nr:transposase family protein [Halobacteriovoraceae bacterium]
MFCCPKCATLSKTCYDKREVIIKDTPLRDKMVHLKITKRRFFCKTCKKPKWVRPRLLLSYSSEDA